MLKKHRHQFEGLKKHKKMDQHPENGSKDMSKLPIIRSLADIGKTHSSAKSKNALSNCLLSDNFPLFTKKQFKVKSIFLVLFGHIA